ncbi:MAG: signal recognition particle receptor subunit alpha, partial [archaeon]
MFDLLKKRISGFAQKVLGNAEKIETPISPAQEKENVNLSPAIEEKRTHAEMPVHEEAARETPAPTPTEQAEELTRVAESEEEPANPTPIPEYNPAPAQPVSHALPEVKIKNTHNPQAKVGIASRLGGMLTGTLTLNAETVNQFLEEFEFSLLEADVELNTATALIEELRSRLSNKTISSREDPTKIILSEIKAALYQIIQVEELDLDGAIRAHHPCVILI